MNEPRINRNSAETKEPSACWTRRGPAHKHPKGLSFLLPSSLQLLKKATPRPIKTTETADSLAMETTPEKISSRYAFPRGWELGFIGGEKSKPPSGTKGRQPACVLKPLFGRNGLASPKGDLQICSEVGNSRGRVLVPDCPLPALQRHSNILELYSMKEQASGMCQRGLAPYWSHCCSPWQFQRRRPLPFIK